MSNVLVLSVDAATLQNGFCPEDYQALANGLAAIFTVTFPSTFTGISVSSTKPSDTTLAWLQLDSLGRPVRLYFFAQGAWLSQHPAASGLTQWWFNTLPDFTTFDGGDANGIGPTSGPMWQLAKDKSGNVIAAQFPIAAGTLPSATVLAVGDVGGEEKHVLTPAEGVDVSHTHVTGRFDSDTGSKGDDAFLLTGSDTQAGTARGAHGDNGPETQEISGLTGLYTVTGPVRGGPTVVGHNTMPPYVVGYLLQRTVRQFYAVM